VKTRTRRPNDDPRDLALDFWAGVLPLRTRRRRTRPGRRASAWPCRRTWRAGSSPRGLRHAGPVQQSVVGKWQSDLDELANEWAPLRPPPPPRWSQAEAEQRLLALRAEQQRLIAGGAWLGGPYTVLEILGLAADELSVSRLLAWLLRPDGRHGLHDMPLRHVLALAGAPATGELDPVRIQLEEPRETVDPDPLDPLVTRADVVVYTRHATLVVESKVYAPEQRHQLDRLKRTWHDSVAPAFLFVTRTPTVQLTSAGEGAWHAVTWSDLAAGLLAACPPGTGVEALAVLNNLGRV
jgi:hypothetical protein